MMRRRIKTIETRQPTIKSTVTTSATVTKRITTAAVKATWLQK